MFSVNKTTKKQKGYTLLLFFFWKNMKKLLRIKYKVQEDMEEILLLWDRIPPEYLLSDTPILHKSDSSEHLSSFLNEYETESIVHHNEWRALLGALSL